MDTEPPPEPSGSSEGGNRRSALIAAVAGVVIAAFIALLVIGLTAGGQDTSIDRAIAAGDPEPAPRFTLPLLANAEAIGRRDGEQLSLSDLRGRPVLLNFWASWCDPCKREAPVLEDAWRRARARGVVVLGVDVQDLTGDARDFIERYGQTYPTVRDGGERTYRAYGLTGVPETFFVDRQGRVRVHWIGEIGAEQVAQGLEIIEKRDDS